MLATPQSPQIATPERRSDPLDDLLSVISELTDMMIEENSVLAAGLPAFLAANAERKHELADEFEKRKTGLTGIGDPVAIRTLTDAVTQLRDVTAENMDRLEAAMRASRHRVEAVMQAAGAAAPGGTPYTAKGKPPLATRLAAFGKDHHA